MNKDESYAWSVENEKGILIAAGTNNILTWPCFLGMWRDMKGAPRDNTPVLLLLSEPIQGYRVSPDYPLATIEVAVGWTSNDRYWETVFCEQELVDSEGGMHNFNIKVTNPLGWIPMPGKSKD